MNQKVNPIALDKPIQAEGMKIVLLESKGGFDAAKEIYVQQKDTQITADVVHKGYEEAVAVKIDAKASAPRAVVRLKEYADHIASQSQEKQFGIQFIYNRTLEQVDRTRAALSLQNTK